MKDAYDIEEKMDQEKLQRRSMYKAMLKQAQLDPQVMKIFKKQEREKEKRFADDYVIDFDAFDNFVHRMRDEHEKCGPNCVHLQRFYNKIGYYTMGNNRKTLELKKMDIWDTPDKKRHRQRLPMIPRRKPKIIVPSTVN